MPGVKNAPNARLASTTTTASSDRRVRPGQERCEDRRGRRARRGSGAPCRAGRTARPTRMLLPDSSAAGAEEHGADRRAAVAEVREPERHEHRQVPEQQRRAGATSQKHARSRRSRNAREQRRQRLRLLAAARRTSSPRTRRARARRRRRRRTSSRSPRETRRRRAPARTACRRPRRRTPSRSACRAARPAPPRSATRARRSTRTRSRSPGRTGRRRAATAWSASPKTTTQTATVLRPDDHGGLHAEPGRDERRSGSRRPARPSGYAAVSTPAPVLPSPSVWA